MPAKLRWVSHGSGGGKYAIATGLWGEYRVRPPLSHGGRYDLIWQNVYGYPWEPETTRVELGSFHSLSAAKAAAKAHLKLLKSTAVG
jgi:hypothetical protein